MKEGSKRLIIVDISSFIFRAFFAIRPLHSPDGTPVNAVYGVLTMLLKILQVYKPTHVLLAKETKGGSFRNELYSEYKANRSEPPEDLVPQFDLIEQLTDKMKLPMSVDDRYEADDIIGTACTKWASDFDEILIASGDKDLMQFVSGNIKMVDTMKDVIYDEEEVYKKMGVHPHQIVDYLSLVGDSSDNIPGMKGIGAKGAAKLLEEFNSLEGCIENKEKLKGKRVIDAFNNFLEDAFLSKKLVQIVTDLDLKISPADTEFLFSPEPELISFLESLGFKGVIKKVQGFKKSSEEKKLPKPSKSNQAKQEELQEFQGTKEVGKDSAVNIDYVETPDQLESLCKKLQDCKKVGQLNYYSNEEDIFARRVGLMGLSLEGEQRQHFLIPFKTLPEKVFGKKELFDVLAKTWSDESKLIISYDVKEDMTHADTIGVDFKASFFDITQAHFVYDPSSRHDQDHIIESLLGFNLVRLDKKEALLEASKERQMEVLGPRITGMIDLENQLKEEMENKELYHIYRDIDQKLIPVLAQMERQGVELDLGFFESFEKELQEKLDGIQSEVNKLGHEAVNLNSPKQVGQLLFEILELPIIKKTKTGPSTDSEVLEELASRDLTPIPDLILQYREIGKLLSTYVKAFPLLVNPTSKRLHTSFNQHVAQTGRLSSTHPNLQNIPIRTLTGRKIRKGFVAGRGKLLLGADYSQVELRILAHLSHDDIMIKAFQDGLDIHAQTASEVLGIKLSEVTSDERSKAKAVNFGLMYGQSSFGLAKALRISRKEAKEYIDAYFTKFKKVKIFLDSLKEQAEKDGYSKTMMGRKRYLSDIYSQNRTIKANAQRIAVNSPIQGTAADIIKMAMLKISAELKQRKMQTQMLLQVHDELIFELPSREKDELIDLVKREMENIVELSVPLPVDIGVGANWYDLK